MEHEDVVQLEGKIAWLLDYSRKMTDECARLEGIVREKNETISRLEDDIERLNDERNAVRGRIESIVNQIDELNIQVASKTQESSDAEVIESSGGEVF